MGASLCSFRRLPKEDGADTDKMKSQKQQQEEKKKKSKKRELQYYQKKSTLEDCLLASPGVKKDYSIRGGELHVFRNYCSSSSSRVHPSAGTSRVIPALVKSDPSITEQQHYKEDHSLLASSSLSRSQSGRLIKKKVSFRMPKESDIILFDPEEEISSGKCSSDIHG